jgi:uncharacterized protein YegJ (DUF2314 family)
MGSTRLLKLALCLGIAAWVASGVSSGFAQGTVSVSAGDAAMQGAVEQARATLPAFWKALASPAPEESRFAVMVEVSDGSATERLWLTRIQREADGTLFGRINNKPSVVKTFELGQRIQFKEAEIADWLFMRNGKIVGNETLKVLFERMPPEKAALFRSLYETR